MEKAQSKSILVAASGFVYAPSASNNLGDRAQLTRTVERLRAAFPDSRLVAIANSLNDEANLDDLEVSYSAVRYLSSPITIDGIRVHLPRSGTRAVRCLLLLANARRVSRGGTPLFLSPVGRRALRELEESSALFLSGAGTFNDLYITGVGGFWGVLARSVSSLGKPVVASGQQVGPFTKFSRRMLGRWALRAVDLLGVRDPLSIEASLAVHVPRERVVLTGDDAWSLAPAPGAVARATLAKQGIPVESFIAAQMRFGTSVGWDETDSRGIAASLSRLSSELGLPIVFVPCMTSHGADDRYAAACVREQLDVPSWAISEELDARTTKAVLGEAALGVGTANHFCVFAASMGTPVIGLHASPYMAQKIAGIAELWPGRVTALPKETASDPSVLVAAAQRLLNERIERNGEALAAQPSRELRPDAPIRFLDEHLGDTVRQAYSSRFMTRASVEAYEREFALGEFMKNVSDLELDAVQSALDAYRSAPFKRHLDFACGTGRATGFVQSFVETTVGVDVSPAMLERARERFPTARFICGSVTTNPDLANQLGPFDLVTMWRFVAGAEPSVRVAALGAIARCMGPGGLLLVNNNANRSSLLWPTLFVKSLVRGGPLRASRPYRSSLPHRELCHLLEAGGFRVRETKAICYLPPQLASRLPAWMWMPLERTLGRWNIAAHRAVSELVIAIRLGSPDDKHPYRTT